MNKYYLHPFACLILLIGVLTSPSQTLKAQGPPPKSGLTVSAGIPKEQLQKEAGLKKSMDAGEEAYRQGKYEQAISRFQEALESAKRLDAKDEEYARLWTTSDALAKIGSSYLNLHQYAKAETTFVSLVEFRKQNIPYDSSVAGAIEDLAVVDATRGDLPKAEGHLRQAIAYVDDCVTHFKHSDAYDPQDIVANNDRMLKMRLLVELATVYADQGKFDEALWASEEAFQIGDNFKAEPKSMLEVVSRGAEIAKLSNRAEKLKVWLDRQEAYRASKDLAR